ncbi:AarF/ABC1/UbiB kinase family protein [bacterium]|nr:AarF/ABC1/UbiB kinase family protein [bacterium]
MATTIAQKFRNVSRLSQIVNILARYGFSKELRDTELASFVTEVPSEEQNSENSPPVRPDLSGARRLALAFEELGPTFVKLGQLLASREDVFPKDVIVQLRRLQDRAKPVPNELIQKILDSEYHGRTKDYFDFIDPEPLGSASIGQVHKARLRDGRDVVLKIQRPEIESIIKTDLSILAGLASVLEGAIPEIRLLRPSVVVEELKKSLFAELDYFREAANTERMRTFFESDATIYIPEILRSYCTRHVLCMEAIAGQKLTRLERSEEHNRLVAHGVRAFLDMTFKHGMFHADLHPGNFILMDSGRLAILDFGLTARLTRDMRVTMNYLFVALVNEDVETFARLFIELTEARGDVDRKSLEDQVRDKVDSVFSLPLRELQLGKLLMQIARIAASHNAPVSRDLVLFFRGLIALESFGRSLDPHFEVLRETADYAKTFSQGALARSLFQQDSLLMIRDSQALVRELPFTLRILTKRLQQGDLAATLESPDVKRLSSEIERAGQRLSLALILGALVLGSSLLTFNRKGPLFDSLATFGLLGFGVAALVGLWLIVAILKSGRQPD